LSNHKSKIQQADFNCAEHETDRLSFFLRKLKPHAYAR
ncbi:unnamed protein product, partial [marine sediment metagenome]